MTTLIYSHFGKGFGNAWGIFSGYVIYSHFVKGFGNGLFGPALGITG